jgi:hypothetical protein
MLEMANARLYPFWGSLTEALRSGSPQNEARRGGDFFGELYRDRDRLKQFLHAMTGLSMGAHKAIAAKFPWETTKRSSMWALRRAASRWSSRSPTST